MMELVHWHNEAFKSTLGVYGLKNEFFWIFVFLGSKLLQQFIFNLSSTRVREGWFLLDHSTSWCWLGFIAIDQNTCIVIFLNFLKLWFFNNGQHIFIILSKSNSLTSSKFVFQLHIFN